MSKPLNNNTNIYHNKQQQPLQQQTLWRKPELQIQRPLTRESDVQRLKQSTKENHDIHGSSANKGFPNLSAAETLARKKKFATYKFYLDNLEPQVHKRIERGIRLLGAVKYNNIHFCSLSNTKYIFRQWKPSFQVNVLILLPLKQFLYKKICYRLPVNVIPSKSYK
jgi:hypothetical protein